MTQSEYDDIARAFRASKPQYAKGATIETWRRVQQAVMVMLDSRDIHFDRKAFDDNCGINSVSYTVRGVES